MAVRLDYMQYVRQLFLNFFCTPCISSFKAFWFIFVIQSCMSSTRQKKDKSSLSWYNSIQFRKVFQDSTAAYMAMSVDDCSAIRCPKDYFLSSASTCPYLLPRSPQKADCKKRSNYPEYHSLRAKRAFVISNQVVRLETIWLGPRFWQELPPNSSIRPPLFQRQ
jgi:hypothetical protein